jgi:O-antigen/teichoic acid export membrane protein
MSQKLFAELPPTAVDTDHHFRTDHLKTDLGGRSARGGTIMIVSQGVKFFITMGSAVILARLLTPLDYGLIAMVAVVANFSYPFRNLGLSAATMQRAEINDQQVSTLFWINVALSVAAMLITAAIAPAIASFYGDSRLILITVAIAAGFIFGGLTVQHEALLKRQMRFAALVIIELTSILIGTATAIILAWRGAGYWALVFSQWATGATSAAGVWVACRWRPGLPARNSGVRSMLAFGRNLTGYNILNYLSRNIDNLLIGRYWGPQQLGFYARAYQLLLLPLDQIVGPIDGVAVTALSRLADNEERYRQAYLRMLEKLAMVTMPAMALMIATSDWIVLVILGPQWIETGQIFALLGIIGLLEPISSTMGWLLISQGRTHHIFQWGLIDAALSTASIVGGLRWGAVGVAASYAIVGLCIRKPLQFWFVTRSGPVRTSDFYRAIIPSLVASASVMAVLVSFRSWAEGSRPIVGLLASLGIAIMIALLSFLLLPRGRQALQDVRSLITLLLKKGTAVH